MLLKDNSISESFNRADVAPLFPFADKKISELSGENGNLLIFPYCCGDKFKDDIGENVLFSLQNTGDEKVRIVTGNVMGFFNIGGIKVKIRSRFADDEKDYFLHYMLQRVLCFNIIDLQHETDDEEVFDLLMLMFPYVLRNALRQGLYREYQRFRYNDANVRGAIDVATFIKKDVPFAGKVAYTTREYSCDNSMTELVRHTIEFMKSKKFGKAVLNKDKDVKSDVTDIVSATPTYDRAKRGSVIQKNLRHKVHPYYTNYAALRTLCLQILRRDGMKYGYQEREISGVLFDGAWLWEEYVNEVLKGEGFVHPRNKSGEGRICLFTDNSGWRYPDFYKENIVLDTKYKRLDDCEKVADVGRDDIHQIIAYMTVLRAKRGGFIAPLEKKKDVVTSYLNGTEGSTVSILGIEIAKERGGYQEFVEAMRENEGAFVELVKLLN